MNGNSQFRLIKEAVLLARKFHDGQVRKGPIGEAFYNHPRRVCKCYLTYKYKSMAGALASLCHDLVEDTSLSIEEIGDLFGAEVRNIVWDLTKPHDSSSDEYADRICDWNLESKKIKLCDIEDNILSSRKIHYKERGHMLARWKKYLDQLKKNSPNGLTTEGEFIYKWKAVNQLHTLEWQALSADSSS